MNFPIIFINRHADAVSDQVRGMGDHALAFPQPVKDFDLEIGAMARFNHSQLRNAVLDDERVPSLTGTEQRVQWRLQSFVRFPDDDPRLHFRTSIRSRRRNRRMTSSPESKAAVTTMIEARAYVLPLTTS